MDSRIPSHTDASASDSADAPLSSPSSSSASVTAAADVRTAAPVRAKASGMVIAQTMFLVGVTTAFAAAGAWVGRDFGIWASLGCWVAAIVVLVALSAQRKARATGFAMFLLFCVGLLLGMAAGPTIAYYTSGPDGAVVLAQSAALTALFIAGFGAVGAVISRDLAPLARIAFFVLLGLIVFGFISVFVAIPNAMVIYSIIGLVIFAVFTMYDFQKLRRAGEEDVVILAAGIFLDIFNVFLFILSLLGGSR